jgi:hypothetical protein
VGAVWWWVGTRARWVAGCCGAPHGPHLVSY